jgi:hypothetical protein
MARGRVEDRHIPDAFLINEPSQLGVDLARGEILGVEASAVAVDLGDARDLVVELDEAAGVEQDLGLAAVRSGGGLAARYRVQTITSPS